MRVEEESEKAVLKLNIQKTNIMASGPITSWQINGKQWKQWQTSFSWVPKITADGDCNHEIKRHLLLGRKVMTNLDSIFKTKKLLCQQRLSAEELMLLNCGVGEDSWESLGLKEYPTSFSSVQSLSHVRLFATPWIAARQASLFITNSRSSLRLTIIESVMPSNNLILRHPLLLLPPISPSIRVFCNESTLHEVAKILEFQL